MKSTGRQLFGAAAMAVWLAIGAGMIWGLACFFVTSIGQSLLVPRDPWYRTVVVRSDGTPLVEIRSTRNYQNIAWETFDGAKVAPADEIGGIPQAAGAGLPPPHRILADFPRLTWNSRIAATTDLRSPHSMWYLVHDGCPEGHGYFVGYDSESRQCLGYIGVGGNREDRPPADDQFPMRGGAMRSASVFESYAPMGRSPYPSGQIVTGQAPPWLREFISGDRICRFDPRQRTVTPLMELKGVVSLGLLIKTSPLPAKQPGTAEGKPQTVAWPAAALLAVRTLDRIVLVDRAAAKIRAEFNLPSEVRETQFAAYLVGDDEMLLIATSRRNGDFDANAYWVSSDGTVRRRQSCRLAEGKWADTPSAFATAACAIAPAPIVASFASVLGPADVNLNTREATTWSEAIGQVLPQAMPPLAVLTLVSAGLAWRCYRRQVRYALPGTAWWVVMVFLGGLPGYLGYRFHRPWAPLRACPACGRQSPRDRESCAACGQQFPTPAKLGNEVFAA